MIIFTGWYLYFDTCMAITGLLYELYLCYMSSEISSTTKSISSKQLLGILMHIFEGHYTVDLICSDS